MSIMEPTYKVELISLTESKVEGVDSCEDLIAYTARVSNPSNQLNMETAPKLLNYLWTHSHVSPFEMADMCISIETSRGIAPQILRHWSFSFQEFSQRYAEAQECVIYPARRQDQKNRQNSVDDLDEETKEWFVTTQHEIWNLAFHRYQQALELGIAKEQARFLLPLGTKTKLYMKGNVRSWIHYLLLRSANGTQKEHQEIAEAIIQQIFIPNFPDVSQSLGWRIEEKL